MKNFERCLGAEANIIRLGGDEFACLFGGDDPRAALDAAEHALRTDVTLLEATGGEPASVSIGIVTVPPGQSLDLEKLYRRADSVMYEVKRQRNLKRRDSDDPGHIDGPPAHVVGED